MLYTLYQITTLDKIHQFYMPNIATFDDVMTVAQRIAPSFIEVRAIGTDLSLDQRS